MKTASTDVLQHLSEEQLDEILMEIAEPETCAHAAACALCAGRLEEFRVALGEFNRASLAWSEARSNTLTRDLRAHRPGARLSLTALWSYVSAGAVAAALLLTAGVEHHASHEAGVASAALAGSDYASSRQQEIASDNAMLAAISSEIERPTAAASILDDGKNAALRRQARD